MLQVETNKGIRYRPTFIKKNYSEREKNLGFKEALGLSDLKIYTFVIIIH